MDPRLRSDPLNGAIPTIPYQSIAAFLSRPSILTPDQVKNAPYVIAFRDDHEVAGSGNEVYMKNLNAPNNARYSVVQSASRCAIPMMARSWAIKASIRRRPWSRSPATSPRPC